MYVYSFFIVMTLSCLYCFSNIYIIIILLNNLNNITEKIEDTITDDASEGMPTPLLKQIKPLVGKEKMMNPVAIVTIKVCVQLFNCCFVSYES